MDNLPFSHLGSGGFDVLMLHNYTSLPGSYDLERVTAGYSQINLVCWSIGVWAGQKLFFDAKDVFQRIIAVNGTLCPIHDNFGIPESVFEGTLLNYDEAGRKKFYHRMCREKLIYRFFLNNQPERTIDDQLEELVALKEMIDCTPPEKSMYKQVIITDHDLVVPTANQVQYWQEAEAENTLLTGVHFPFTTWKSWGDFLSYTDSVYSS